VFEGGRRENRLFIDLAGEAPRGGKVDEDWPSRSRLARHLFGRPPDRAFIMAGKRSRLAPCTSNARPGMAKAPPIATSPVMAARLRERAGRPEMARRWASHRSTR
jgi:hypothetical protein